jgi:hypothetical protein
MMNLDGVETGDKLSDAARRQQRRSGGSAPVSFPTVRAALRRARRSKLKKRR